MIAIDLGTRQQLVLSRAGTAGDGAPFENITSLAIVEDPPALIVANQAAENLMRVDLVTGDRSVELEQCLNDVGENVLGNDETLQQLVYRPLEGDLLILSDHLLRYDSSAGQCTVLFPWTARRGLLAVAPAPGEQVLGTVFGALVAVDLPSRQAVIVSK